MQNIRNLIKAVLTVVMLLSSISFVNAQNTMYVGTWHSGVDSDHSIEFFSDGSFLEKNGNTTMTGMYSAGTDGGLTLTYTPYGLPYSAALIDRVTLNGDDLTLYIDGTPTTWSRTFTSTYIAPMTDTYTSNRLNTTTTGLSGIWYSNLDGDHSIEFFSDGSFLERNNGITSSGLYTTGSDGGFSLTYTPLNGSTRVVEFDRFALNGNNITWYNGSSPMTFTNTESNTYVPPLINTYSSKPMLDINGVWRMSMDGKHTMQFMKDMTFREVIDGQVYTGTYNIDSDNRLTLTYTVPENRISNFDKLRIDGNDLYYFNGDTEIRWMRGIGNTR